MIIPRLLLLFTLVPILELVLLIQMGRWVGLWPTLALVIGTGVLGAALTRREGLRAWRAFQTEVWEGRLPGRAILDGLAIFAGGALLLTPGLMTDLLGLLLLVRPTRRWIQDRAVRRLSHMATGPDPRLRVDAWFVGRKTGSRSASGSDAPKGAGGGERGRPGGREIDPGRPPKS